MSKEMKMVDVFRLPCEMQFGETLMFTQDRVTYALHAINNHDRLTEENAALSKMLESAGNELQSVIERLNEYERKDFRCDQLDPPDLTDMQTVSEIQELLHGGGVNAITKRDLRIVKETTCMDTIQPPIGTGFLRTGVFNLCRTSANRVRCEKRIGFVGRHYLITTHRQVRIIGGNMKIKIVEVWYKSQRIEIRSYTQFPRQVRGFYNASDIDGLPL